jgi:basic membrane protein A and related proteins
MGSKTTISIVLSAALAAPLGLPATAWAFAPALARQPQAASNCGYAFFFENPIPSSTAEQTEYTGIVKAENTFHIRIDAVQGNGLPTAEDELTALANKGCYQAIGTSFDEISDPINQVAKNFPKQKFFIWQGSSTEPNVVAYNTDDAEATYVGGAMAAAMSKTHILGCILGTQYLAPWATGFVMGAHLIDPKTTVYVEYVGSYSDPEKTGAIAVTMASRGADIIYPASGANLQVYLLGRAHHYETIASDPTEYAEALPSHPALAFVDEEAEGTIVYDMFDQFATNTVPGRNVLLGLPQGLANIPYITGPGITSFRLTPAVIAAGKRAYDAVLAGQVKLPVA